MIERWEEIEGFPEYAVSDMGEVVSIKRDIVRRPSINAQGVYKVTLSRDGRLATRSVAVLVAEQFVEGKSELNDTVIHLDGDRSNCRADNLMWKPRWFAIKFHRQFLNPKFYEDYTPFYDLATGEEYHGLREAAMRHGLHFEDIRTSIMNHTHVPATYQEFRLIQ